MNSVGRSVCVCVRVWGFKLSDVMQSVQCVCVLSNPFFSYCVCNFIPLKDNRPEIVLSIICVQGNGGGVPCCCFKTREEILKKLSTTPAVYINIKILLPRPVTRP